MNKQKCKSLDYITTQIHCLYIFPPTCILSHLNNNVFLVVRDVLKIIMETIDFSRTRGGGEGFLKGG